MDITLAVLSFIVAVLAVLQGLSMRRAHRSSNNNSAIIHKLDTISGQLELLSRRIDDIWEKLNK